MLTNAWVCVCVCVCVCIYTRETWVTHIYTRICMYAWIHADQRFTCTYMYTHTHTHAQARAHTHTRMHTHTHTHAYTHTHKRTHTHARVNSKEKTVRRYKYQKRVFLTPGFLRRVLWLLVQPIPLGVTFSKTQSSKLERLFCHISVKRDVRALSFELWCSIRKCHPKWD